MIIDTQKTWPAICETHETEQEWREARKSGIGASEVAAIFGCGYKTSSIVTVWADKTEAAAQQEIDEETQEMFDVGHEMEPFIARRFEKRTGLTTHDPGRFTIFRHGSIPWLFSTLDRFVVHPEFGPIPLELKHVNGRFRHEWKECDDPALKFNVQCQTQMEVTGTNHCYLAGWIGGDTLSVHLIERNQRFIDAMVVRLQEFWGYVERREMPPVDESEATRAMLGLIFPHDDGQDVILPGDAVDWDRELLEVKEQLKALEARKDGLENKLKAAIGKATRGCLPVGSYTWKEQTRSGIDARLLRERFPEAAEACATESSFRVLRRSSK